MTATPRVRSRGEQSPTKFVGNYFSYGPPPLAHPVTVVEKTSVNNYPGSFKRIMDVVHGGFRKSADPSKWVFGPLLVESITATASNGSATTSNVPDAYGRGITRTWSGDGVGFILGALVPIPNSVSFGAYRDLVNGDRLSNQAIIECLSRINPTQSQSLVTVAEAGKSVNMIFERAKKLAAAYVACRKGDAAALKVMFPGLSPAPRPKRVVVWDDNGSPIIRKNGKVVQRYGHKPLSKHEYSLLEDPARLWLEYRYGWSPLVLDIQDSLKAIYAQDLRDQLRKQDYTRVFGLREGSANEVTSHVSPSFGGGKWSYQVAINHTFKAKAYAKYRVSRESGMLNRMNDFGAFDVPRAAWELVPFSFVADWFIPIGDWLAAVQPKIGVEVISSGYVIVASKKVVRTLSGYQPDGIAPGQWPQPPFPLGASDSFETKVVSRTIGLPMFPFPTPEVKINFKRIADAVSLFKGVHRSTQRI